MPKPGVEPEDDVEEIVCVACGKPRTSALVQVSVDGQTADFFAHKRCAKRKDFRERMFAVLAQGKPRTRHSMLNDFHADFLISTKT